MCCSKFPHVYRCGRQPRSPAFNADTGFVRRAFGCQPTGTLRFRAGGKTESQCTGKLTLAARENHCPASEIIRCLQVELLCVGTGKRPLRNGISIEEPEVPGLKVKGFAVRPRSDEVQFVAQAGFSAARQ